MKIKKLLIRLVVLCLILYWPVCLLVCEVQTKLYGEPFASGYQDDVMFRETEKYKVIRYNGTEAKVYYYEPHEGGCVIYWTKENGTWKVESWDCVWSRTGSASRHQWPYFYHYLGA